MTRQRNLPLYGAFDDQNFPEALEAYAKAIELDGTNMSFVSNRAAVYFEQKNYDGCIDEVGGRSRSPCLVVEQVSVKPCYSTNKWMA